MSILIRHLILGMCVWVAGCSTLGASGAASVKRQCNDKDPAACYLLGGMHEIMGASFSKETSRKAGTHRAKALGLYKAACKSGDAASCFLLAENYLHGGLVAKSLRRSVEYHDRACIAGDGVSCHRLGFMYELGKGGKRKNKSRAYDYYRRSCELGEDPACAQADRLRPKR